MERVIISGATGAIGTAIINELVNNNVEVLVLCRKDSKRNNQIPVSPLVTKKYCALNELKNLNNDSDKKYDVFYHLAWDGTFGDSRNDLHLQNKNVDYALDAVETAKRFGCTTFIGVGSQAEYGRVEGVLSAETPTNPENGYGIAKLCAGHMTRERAHQLNMKHIWVRVLSVYGPNDGVNSMVTSTVLKLINGETPKFTKGEQLWDYLYSKDAARAFYLLGRLGTDGKTYVLGGGREQPLAEYIRTIRDVVSPNAQIDLGAIPYNDRQVMRLCADISELVKDTNWKPVYNFKDGISETYNFLKNK